VGGPAWKNKLFFFGSYAGYRFVSANILTTTVPSAAMQAGNVTETIPTATASQVADNLKCTIAAQSSTQFWACNPALPKATAWCPNNICPVSTFDPAIAAIIKAGLIPTPNPSAAADTIYTRRDLSPFSQKTNEQLYKMDYQLAMKQRLTVSE